MVINGDSMVINQSYLYQGRRFHHLRMGWDGSKKSPMKKYGKMLGFHGINPQEIQEIQEIIYYMN